MLQKNADAQTSFWRPFINRLEEGTYTELEAGSTLVLGLQAKNYELIDHQFVRVTLSVQFPKTGKGEMVILLPRQHVLAIIEGKTAPLEGFKNGTKTNESVAQSSPKKAQSPSKPPRVGQWG